MKDPFRNKIIFARFIAINSIKEQFGKKTKEKLRETACVATFLAKFQPLLEFELKFLCKLVIFWLFITCKIARALYFAPKIKIKSQKYRFCSDQKHTLIYFIHC